MFVPTWIFWLLCAGVGSALSLHLKTILFLNEEKNKKKGVTATAITTAAFYLVLAVLAIAFPMYFLYIRL